MCFLVVLQYWVSLPPSTSNVNPYDEEAVFKDYERRQRQIEADKALADRMQRQEYDQQQSLSKSQQNQDLTRTDEELAVCLLANELHQQEGSTSQSEPEQTFSRAACSSNVSYRAELNDVIARSRPQLADPLCYSAASSFNDVTDASGDQQALEEALRRSLLESQLVHDDVSHQQALDEAIAMSMSTSQQNQRNGGSDQQALDAAIALSLSQASGQTHEHTTPGDDYEDLLEIEELIGSVAVMSLSQTQLQLLPTYKYEERHLKTSGNADERREVCAICLEMYESGSDVKRLPCLHIFHTKCIDEWLQRKAICPTCNIRVEL